MKQSVKNRAASVDASGRADVPAGPSDTAKASARRAYAEVAAVKSVPAPGTPRNRWPEDMLPKDGLGFAEALHHAIDLVSVTQELLRDEDVKLRQKVLEQVLDLAYGRNGRMTEPGTARPKDGAGIDFGVPRPEED